MCETSIVDLGTLTSIISCGIRCKDLTSNFGVYCYANDPELYASLQECEVGREVCKLVVGSGLCSVIGNIIINENLIYTNTVEGIDGVFDIVGNIIVSICNGLEGNSAYTKGMLNDKDIIEKCVKRIATACKIKDVKWIEFIYRRYLQIIVDAKKRNERVKVEGKVQGKAHGTVQDKTEEKVNLETQLRKFLADNHVAIGECIDTLKHIRTVDKEKEKQQQEEEVKKMKQEKIKNLLERLQNGVDEIALDTLTHLEEELDKRVGK